MKSRTKAQKLKAKRGRPRLEPAAREPNGRRSRRVISKEHSRQQNEAETMNVAVQKRILDGNLTDYRGRDGRIVTATEQAIDPMRGYLLGRLRLSGNITHNQHSAGIKFAEDMARYYGLTGIRFPSPRAQDLFAIRGDDGEVSTNRADMARSASAKMATLRTKLMAVGDINTGRRVYTAIMAVCVMEEPANIELVRRGLNALERYYQVPS